MAVLTGTKEGDNLAATHSPNARWVWAIARIGLGFTFLWAFFDKLLALGFATGRLDDGTIDRAAAWINGGSPTLGFLKFATKGPFAELFQGLAGTPWANSLFMIGLAGIGLALVLGVGMRIAAATGTLLLVLMWAAALPPANNPFWDNHLFEATVLIGLAMVGAGNSLGLGKVWGRTGLVQRYPFLQ